MEEAGTEEALEEVEAAAGAEAEVDFPEVAGDSAEAEAADRGSALIYLF